MLRIFSCCYLSSELRPAPMHPERLSQKIPSAGRRTVTPHRAIRSIRSKSEASVLTLLILKAPDRRGRLRHKSHLVEKTMPAGWLPSPCLDARENQPVLGAGH